MLQQCCGRMRRKDVLRMAGVMTAQIALLSVASFLPPTMTRTVVSTLGSCSLALPIIGYFIVLSCSEALDDWPSIGRIVLFGLCSVVFSLITFSCFAFVLQRV